MAARDVYGALDVEPSLLPPSSRLVRSFVVPGLDRGYLRHLEERIQRDPRDLHAHVERVLLRIAHRDRADIYAALVDLCVALGTCGRALRARLVAAAAAQLTPGQRAFLEAHLDAGLDASSAGAAVRGSCLAWPVAGTMQIVRRRRAASEPPRGDALGPVALAREWIASGDDAAAQSLLEETLERDPGQAEVCLELLALYRRSGARADFERTRTALLGRRTARPEEWDRTAAWFESRSAPA
jgi:hypothetical protein